ncbi:vacuolar protein sorting-associated protein 29 [[Candida] railenensis]|uniref:Vacuolar protein sorting-associated protein 29 n=1 Tax=[Candida] railenensis TaxID=45579 RepID=A0A9P0QMS2_9ASCO|nr:vacuolar protein sorting-associated protein 29 [[Candida] railenensis]
MLTLAIGDLFIPDRSIQLPAKFQKLLSPNPGSIPSNNKISKVLCLGNITQSYDTLEFLYNLSPSFNIVRGEFDDTQLLTSKLKSLSAKDAQVPLYSITAHDNLKIGYTNGYQIVPRNDPLSLLTLAREMDVDVLIWGGTHKIEAYTLDGKFFINPGSATGAFTFDWPERYEEEEEEEEEEDGSEATDTGAPKEDEEKQDQTEEKAQEQEGGGDATVDEDNLEADSEKEKNPEELWGPGKVDLSNVPELEEPIPSFCLLDTHDSTCTLYIYTYLDGEVKVDKVSYTKE